MILMIIFGFRAFVWISRKAFTQMILMIIFRFRAEVFRAWAFVGISRKAFTQNSHGDDGHPSFSRRCQQVPGLIDALQKPGLLFKLFYMIWGSWASIARYVNPFSRV